MTELLYLKDSYLREFEAEVVAVKGNAAILSRTAFYPGGGGQPNDLGILRYGRTEIKVLRVYKQDGEVLHELERAELPFGSRVVGVVDWDQRYAHMRHHTAIHVISGVVWRRFKAISTGSHIYRDRARVDFDLEQLTTEMAREIEGESNRIVKEDRRVIVSFLPRDEAIKNPDLFRTEPGAALAQVIDIVRIVEIEGFDAQADGGTHVSRTGEIGTIRIARTESKGRRNKRMEIVLA